MVARAAEYGVDVGSVRVDMKRVKARKDAVSKESRTGLEDWLRNMENCTVYNGHARFESAHEVSLGEERLHADKIFINVGGRALVPDMPGLPEIDFLTNSSMMSVDFLPKHLIVVGGSYIGLEFGQMFRRFGAEVTIIGVQALQLAWKPTEELLALDEALSRLESLHQGEARRHALLRRHYGVLARLRVQLTHGLLCTIDGPTSVPLPSRYLNRFSPWGSPERR